MLILMALETWHTEALYKICLLSYYKNSAFGVIISRSSVSQVLFDEQSSLSACNRLVGIISAIGHFFH